MKRFYKKILLVLLISAAFTGCKRPDEIAPGNPTTPSGSPVNDLTQVTAEVSGIVLDENKAPVANATVTSGAATTITNANGMFIFKSVSLSKEDGSVTVVKTGYFKGIRSFKTIEGKNNTVKIQLMAKVLSGTVDGATGGTITSNGGATILFPANAFTTRAGAQYTGAVKVYSRWIDPTAANLPGIIPGDLRGITKAGAENILETYGMAGAELEDVSGNVLKIAPGKTATISFPIPSALNAAAPASIALWHFDDATARWKETGTAARAGNFYTAQVDKFSFWNCDVATPNVVKLDFTVLNAANNAPFVSTNTRIKRVSNGSYGYGITNNSGFVSGLVPKNEPLVLEVISSCGTIMYSQNINPLSSNTSLGNINASMPGSETITFTGTVLNCNAAPVTNGYVSLYVTGGGAYVPASTAGTFSFSMINCSGNALAYNYQAVDNATTQQSISFSGYAGTGAVSLGNINTCETSIAADVYVAGSIGDTAVIWKNGVVTKLTSGVFEAAANSVFVSGNDVYVAGYEHSTFGDIAKVWKNGMATNLGGGAYPNGASYDAHANSVSVSGSDVYVAGYAFNAAIIWKNGVATTLGGGMTQTYAEAFSVFSSGTDVFIAGAKEYFYPNDGITAAMIWSNSATVSLNTPFNDARAYSVFVSGTGVYVAGEERALDHSVAKVWKNNVATVLSNEFSSALSVFISGTDVYAGGWETVSNVGQLPTLWKNGVATHLSNNDGSVRSVFLSGTDVYAAGSETDHNLNAVAKIWKNGLPINLYSGTARSAAYSVYVK